MKTERQKRIRTIKIAEYTRFKFAYLENAERVSMALARSGYYIAISREDNFFVVYIYEHKN